MSLFGRFTWMLQLKRPFIGLSTLPFQMLHGFSLPWNVPTGSCATESSRPTPRAGCRNSAKRRAPGGHEKRGSVRRSADVPLGFQVRTLSHQQRDPPGVTTDLRGHQP